MEIEKSSWENWEHGGGEHKGEGEENMREQDDGRVERRTKRESRERDIMIEGVIMRVGRNLALEKYSEIHKDESS